MVKNETKTRQNILVVFIIIFFIVLLCIINIFSENQQYKSEHYDNIGMNKELLNIIYFNVGQADSTLITINDSTMLIDTGNGSDGYYIADFLKAQGINKIDYLILTHLDEDHVGGTYKVVQELNIGTIYLPNMESNKKFYKEMMEVINNYPDIIIDKSITASDDVEYKLRKCNMESFKY